MTNHYSPVYLECQKDLVCQGALEFPVCQGFRIIQGGLASALLCHA